jgi:hypothetical protein
MGAFTIKVTWVTIVIAILILFLILWLFAGGGHHEYIGVGPLYSSESELYPNVEVLLPNQREEPVIQISHNERLPSESRFERELSEPQRLQRMQIQEEYKKLLAKSEAEIKAQSTQYKQFGKSKGERTAKRIMEELYSVEFKTVRPPELRSPETGRNLEIDVYSDNVWVNGTRYKIGVEVNGIQHYVFPNFTGQTIDQFKAQIRRDIYKNEACNYHGIYLITVPYTVKEKDMREYIISMIPDCMLPDTCEAPTRDL